MFNKNKTKYYIWTTPSSNNVTEVSVSAKYNARYYYFTKRYVILPGVTEEIFQEYQAKQGDNRLFILNEDNYESIESDSIFNADTEYYII
jgi:hypothetical protein